MIEETNAAEHYERTKFDLYKDDICLSDITTLTYVLMDNLLSLFYQVIGGCNGKKLPLDEEYRISSDPRGLVVKSLMYFSLIQKHTEFSFELKYKKDTYNSILQVAFR